jgi:hypothetical protein
MAKKRHHYIPRFYLGWFTDPSYEGNIWVYDKETGSIFNATPANIGCEKHFHTFVNGLGEKDTETIETLYQMVESPAGALFKKIHAGETLDSEDKAVLAMFATTMMVRVPNFRNNIELAYAKHIELFSKFQASNKEAFESSYRRFLEATGTPDDMPIEELRQFILDGEYTLSVDPQVSLAFSVKSIQEIFGIFYQMNWVFVKATDYKFINCDNPLFYFDPAHNLDSFYGVGLINKNLEVTLPLSRNLCAVGGWKLETDCLTIQGKSEMVKAINRRTAASAQRYVYSSENSEPLNRMIAKYKGMAPTVRVS